MEVTTCRSIRRTSLCWPGVRCSRGWKPVCWSRWPGWKVRDRPAALYSGETQFASTITAIRLSRCLMLDYELVDRLLAEQGKIRENYLHYLTGRIRFLSGRLQTLAQPGVEGKLVRYLLSGDAGPLTCSATGLCQRLGVSRASLYRAFAALEESGLIRREGKTITVLDPAGLETVL